MSPHLDDAVLSCGGLIAALRESCTVEVWTIFTGAPLRGPYSEVARWLHEQSGGTKGKFLSWKRRAEDRRACARLGAKAVHFHFHDAPYRRDSKQNFLYPSGLQAETHRDDDAVVNDVCTLLRRRIAHNDVLVAPLAIGGHVDHRLARRIAEAGCSGRLLYYADFPYVQSRPLEVPATASGLSMLSYHLSVPQVEDWISSVSCYASQVPLLEEAYGSMPELIHKYAAGRIALFGAGSGNPPHAVFSQLES